jgi:uncharacterized membrane protein
MPTDTNLELLRRLERQLDEAHGLIATLRKEAETAAPPPAHPMAAAPSRPARPARPRIDTPMPAPSAPRRSFTDWWDEHGAQGLALGGGVLCLLGVAFLYLFADQRGWVGDGLRVALGSAVSLVLVAVGIELDRRHGRLHAAVTAVGVGLAGLYVSLCAAAGLYDMLPGSAALVLAALIAAAGIGLSLTWSRETLACFAILGAIAVPGVADGALHPLGASFAFVLYCAAAILMVERRWWRLFQASALVVVAEMALTASTSDATTATEAAALAVAAFVGVAAAAAVLYALRVRRPAVPLEVLIQLLAALVATFAAARVLYPDEPSGGIALLVGGLAFAAPGFALLRRDRDLASVLAASGLLLAGVGLGEALHGGFRVGAFALVAVVMSRAGRRLGEGRFALAAVAHLVVAGWFAVAYEAQPWMLFRAGDHTLAAVPSAFAVLLAAIACTRDVKPAWRLRAGSVTLVAAVYTASLLVLGLLQAWGAGGVLGSFQRGETLVTALWAATGIALLWLGLGVRYRDARAAGLLLLAAAVGKLFLFDLNALTPFTRSLAFLAVGVLLLGGGLAYQRLAVTRGSTREPSAPAGTAA